MWIYVIYFLVFRVSYLQTYALWDADVTCPIECTCRLEHLKETAIYRFKQKYKDSQPVTETDQHINNDVLYEDDLESELLEENPLLHAVTCILQTETNPLELFKRLPKDIESLTLIQGDRSGNKSINFSWLEVFSQLIVLELNGMNTVNEQNASHFFCEIDVPLHELKYLNLDKVLIKASKKQLGRFDSEVHEEVVTFEYTQQLNPNLHPLTLVHKGTNREILPYNKYVEQEDNNEISLFIGFNSLVLLRVSNCQLNNVNWEMFDGLQNLEYLILEKNNLMFIPDFAFYGTPNLKSLSLAWNNLLNIQITDLAGLLELEYLDLSHNNFSQLSELSFPPFPKLKLANFGNNPISIVFPSTFEVMNTTDSLVLGSEETPLTLITNSFLGLKLLKKLTLNNLIVPLLKRELLVGMPNLNELIMSGNITKLEFDAFLDVSKLEKLVITQSNLQNISMDAFIGLDQLHILDLSQNRLEYLPPGTFDPLKHLRELYLNNNKFQQLPREIFARIHPRLIRLNENPWHCSCGMSDWKPMIVNKIKQKSAKNCDYSHDKGISCVFDNHYDIKYVFDTRVAPKCATPKKYLNWNVFHVMRKQLRCLDYKPKIKKRIHSTSTQHKNDSQEDMAQKSQNSTQTLNSLNNQITYEQNLENNINEQNKLYAIKMDKLREKIEKHPETQGMYGYDIKSNQDVPMKISFFSSEISTNNDENNDLNYVHTNSYPLLKIELNNNEYHSKTNKSTKINNNSHTHVRKVKKHRKGFRKMQPNSHVSFQNENYDA
ncbi:hypothetical protein ILUMI_20475 [Ignelater luminosus]|uniref:Uncharacterized protein n=1 Tax=Ignelater luminosus TaxID=2038154 RepID=A0A8K0G297_IGNLU|nr:hypothetical protein ILUMI_20475 [Ignelater luminosus]